MAEISLAGEGVNAPSRRVPPFASLTAALAAESERRILWLPGSAAESRPISRSPSNLIWAWSGDLAIGDRAAILLWRRPFAAPLPMSSASRPPASLSSGDDLERATLMLERRLGPPPSPAASTDIDTPTRGWRIIIVPDALRTESSAAAALSRIHITAASDLLSPGGDSRRCSTWFPDKPYPGAYDLQRELYFADRRGRLFLGGAHRPASAEDNSGPGGWRQWLLRLRTDVTRRVTAVLSGSTGGVAAALIAGKRGTIDEPVKEAFRNSGLSHLLAIAGLHLGLVGAFVFFAVRGGLALIPYVALRYPIKKVAAGATLVVLFCYLMLSGAAIPTERAFVMNGIIFAAILIDRLRISMRICAIAAAVVLLLQPESLAGVSFQMSFGAVVALIAVYETYGSALARLLHRGSCAQGARLLRRGGGDDNRGDAWHRSVLDLPLPQDRALFAARQRHRRTDLSVVDLAVGCDRLPADAVRPRAFRAHSDGLGHRRDDLGRRACFDHSRQCLAHAAASGLGPRCGCV